MTKALLDTDILSEIIKSKDLNVVDRARSYLAREGRLTFSSISVMEIISGFCKRQNEAKARRFIEMTRASEVLPLDTIAAELAGRMGPRRAAQGVARERLGSDGATLPAAALEAASMP